MTTFKELGLNPEIINGLDDLGFIEPSPIQEKAIPFILKSKKDLIASAQTGTGKTAAFGLPILNQIKANEKDLLAIILCPTRELCIQISRDITKFAARSKWIKVTAVYGGARIDLQIRSLKNGTNIVVGTPGRVHDLIRRKVLKLQSIKWLVLDEADEMLDMGFKDDLDAILGQTPKTRQTLLFSATISKSVHSIARQYMNEAKEISVGDKNVGAEKVTHEYYVVNARDRFEALKRILDYLPGVYGILFCRTRIETGKVADMLKLASYETEALHGDISQNIRTKIMDRFKQKQIRLLVATDVAARGIDVSDLTHVINYNLPDHDEAYTHRSGRTGRAQKSGVSISILTPREVNKIKKLEEIIGKKFTYKKVPQGNDICRKQIDNFLKDLEETDIKEINNKQYLEEFVEKLKKINKEDLIKLFITQKFKSLMDDYKNTRDLNAELKITRARRENDDNINLKINFGKKHGFNVKNLFALINSNKNLKGVEIGRINIMPEYSIFSVEKRRADAVVNYLNGTNLKGKKIIINKSNMAASYQGKRRNRPNRNFKRKRTDRNKY
ncbi:DEAD/DEAH box helicase [Candidatus Parcubacteria bacterium]|nr:DEAD/DEAH box helicase [Candidatus Parcubacteria bacterium]